MRKIVISLAVVVVVLVAAGIGGVVYVGQEAETRFDAALERLSSPPSMVLKKVRYEGKLFGAEAETSFEISAGPQKIAIPFRHTLSYMPLASGLAEVHTEMVVPPAFKPVVDAVFKGAAPLTGDTVIRFDGSEETRFQSPAFTWKDPNGTVVWQGITGTVNVQGAHVVLNGSAPGMKVQGAMGNLNLQGLTASADMTRAADQMWLGSSSLKVTKLEVNPAMMPAITAEGVQFSSETAEQGAGLLRSRVAIDLKKVGAQDLAFSNVGYELEFSNLDRALLLKFSKAMQNYQPKAGDAGTGMTGLLVADLPAFLKRSPKATIKRCTAVTPWGDFKATASFTFDGKGELPPQPMAWLGRINTEGKLDLSSSLLQWLLQQQVKARASLIANAGKKPQPEQAQMLTEKLAQVRLTRLEQTGALVRNGERYTAELKTVDGTPTVNGKTVQEIAALVE